MIEIERKFLVNSDEFKSEASRSYTIKQGFLNSHPSRTVRIRILDDKGILTIKGKSSNDGLSRFEWEKEVSLTEAEALFRLCEEGIIEKIRYVITTGEHIFEVDEFFGDNEGLIIAELELYSESEPYQNPSWLGSEVTGEIKYYNSYLAKNPYKNW